MVTVPVVLQCNIGTCLGLRLYGSNLVIIAIMAGIVGDAQLFDDHFTITAIDQSKYDRVCRLSGTSLDSQTVMTLDINSELYPCAVGDHLHMLLATSLALDGTKDDGRGWRDTGMGGQGGDATLADMFDYVCHGKIYKFVDGDDGQSL